ncbi:MAG: metallophosphoesterase family protein [Polyangiaceae bacterium]
MRYGILSDIHGNLQALTAALGFLVETMGVDRLVCLGDIVGYNADPDACAGLLAEARAECVTGNHDLVATSTLGFERCAIKPAFALGRTRQAISEETRTFLRGLPARLVIEGDTVAVHGGVRDVCQYVTRDADVLENEAFLRAEVPGARVCLFGHTHERRLWEIRAGHAGRRGEVESKDDIEVDLSAADRRYLINPGSVDAARKQGDPRAEVAIWDTDRQRVSFHRVPYDAVTSERRAAEHGYRMGPVEERLFRFTRRLARIPDRIARRRDTLRSPRCPNAPELGPPALAERPAIASAKPSPS